jgi:hypothetical protein
MIAAAMLRARLLTSLAFHLAIAVWVFHDARARRARKPGFAAVLALVWGPLGLGLWMSERPLRQDEQRRGGAASIAHGFLIGWAALLPAMLALAVQAVEHWAAVPGSLGRQIGILPAASVVTSMFWGGPAVLAFVLGQFARRAPVEHGTASTPATSLPAWVAASVAGAAALACALVMR